MHEQFEVLGGPMDGQFVALDKDHDQEVIVTVDKVKHVYRTIVRRSKDESKPEVRRRLVYVGPVPLD